MSLPGEGANDESTYEIYQPEVPSLQVIRVYLRNAAASSTYAAASSRHLHETSAKPSVRVPEEASLRMVIVEWVWNSEGELLVIIGKVQNSFSEGVLGL